MIDQTGTPATPEERPAPVAPPRRSANRAKMRLIEAGLKVRQARRRHAISREEAEQTLTFIEEMAVRLDELLRDYENATTMVARSLVETQLETIEALVQSSVDNIVAELTSKVETLGRTVDEHTTKLAGHDQQLEGVREDHQKLVKSVRRMEEVKGIKTPVWKYLFAIVVGIIAGWLVWQYNFQNLIEFRTGGVADLYSLADEPWFAIAAGIAVCGFVLGLLLSFGGVRQTKSVERSEERVVQTVPTPTVARHPALSTSHEPDHSGDTAVLPPREPVASRQGGDS